MDVGYIPPPSAVHYEVKDFAFSEFISPIAAKIIALQPELILGTYRLFDYNPLTHVISLSPTFKSLLGLLVDLGELDTSVLKAPSLADINTIFQKPQGEGGLLRSQDWKDGI